MAGRWKSAVLPFFGREDDGSASYDGAHFDAGPPVVLFQGTPRQPVLVYDLFVHDVSRDGQRFLINTQVKQGDGAPMSVIQNWPAKLDK